MKWNFMSVYWLTWLVGGFGIPEGIALYSHKPQNTLSYQVWHLEGSGATFARFWVAAFLLWLLIHMVWNTFR